MGEVVIDLYFDKNSVFVCCAVLEACGIRLRPTWLDESSEATMSGGGDNVRWSLFCRDVLLPPLPPADVRWLWIPWLANLPFDAPSDRHLLVMAD